MPKQRVYSLGEPLKKSCASIHAAGLCRFADAWVRSQVQVGRQFPDARGDGGHVAIVARYMGCFSVISTTLLDQYLGDTLDDSEKQSMLADIKAILAEGAPAGGLVSVRA